MKLFSLFSACYKPEIKPMSSETEGCALLFIKPTNMTWNVKYTQELVFHAYGMSILQNW